MIRLFEEPNRVAAEGVEVVHAPVNALYRLGHVYQGARPTYRTKASDLEARRDPGPDTGTGDAGSSQGGETEGRLNGRPMEELAGRTNPRLDVAHGIITA
jgi:hypothetical protein